MNAESLRREIFELTLQRDNAEEDSQIIQLQFAIEGKIDMLIVLTGLPRARVEQILVSQFYIWLAERGHGTDEAGAVF